VRQVDANQGGNQRITAFIYKEDAKKRSAKPGCHSGQL
jgi:hypothetical protein